MNTICLCFFASTAVMFFALRYRVFPLLLFGLICCGFSYGGVMPSNSAYVRSAFGARYYPVNFSIVALNLLPASYLGPLVSGALYDAGQSYTGTVVCLLLFTVVGAICAGVITMEERRRKRADHPPQTEGNRAPAGCRHPQEGDHTANTDKPEPAQLVR